MATRVVIMGNYGGTNWGDEAILAGLLSCLPKTQFAVTVVSADPAFTRRLHGVDAVLPPPCGLRSLLRGRGRLQRFREALAEADQIVVGGGGIIQDREWPAVFLWGYYLWWVFRARKPVSMVAQSVGPLRFWWSRMIARWAFERADFVSLRDAASVELLTRLGKAADSMMLSTDAVFCLPLASEACNRKGTLLALRGDGAIAVAQAKQLIAGLPHPVTAAVFDRSDRRFAGLLGIPVWEPAGLEDLRQTLRAAQLVVSARLHGNLIALLEATPFVALSAAPKVQAFFDQCGLANTLLPETATAAEIKERTEELLADLPLTLQRLEQVREEQITKSHTILPLDFASAPDFRHTASDAVAC